MKKMIFIFCFSLVLFAGCSSPKTDESLDDPEQKAHQHHSKPSFVQSDLREKTESIEDLPSFLKNLPEDITIIYSAAAKHKEVLEHIPCYCGCGASVGHKSSYECFVHETNDDGSIVWDDHGTNCGVCLEIAATSVMEYQKGSSIADIRDMIDTAYKEGYAAPTPTPMPPSN